MHTRPLTLVVAASALFGLAPLTGCSGHGKYTQEHLDNSKLRVGELKSMHEYQQAHQAFLAGDLNKALIGADRSITINPDVPLSHILKGRILIEMNDLSGAEASLTKAAELDPKNVDAQYYLGIVAERGAQTGEARDRYMAAAVLAPTNAQYVVAAAEMMIDLGMLDQADTYLGQQASVLENNSAVRQTRGHVAMLRGDATAACDLFNQARMLAPDDPAILEDLVTAQIATSRFAEAEYNLSKLLQSPGYEVRRDLQHLRARCLLSVDRPIEARELYVQLTGSDEGAKDVNAWIELGNVSYLLRDERRLRDSSLRVIALAPEKHEGFTLRGLYHRRRGELEQSLENFDKAVERRGAETQPLVLRGLLLEQLGRLEDARASYESALKQNPDDTGVSQLLAALSITGPTAEPIANAPDDGGN